MFSFARGEGGGGGSTPSPSVYGTQPQQGGGAGGRSLGRLFPRSVEVLRQGQQPLQPYQPPPTDPITAMLQSQAVGQDPLGLQQRRAAELMRRRKVLLGGVGGGFQGTAAAPNLPAMTMGSQPTTGGASYIPVFSGGGGGGGFAQSQTSPYSSVFGYNPSLKF